MLRFPEDCKPGTPVICIHAGFRTLRQLFRPNAQHLNLIKVGHQYTVEDVAPGHDAGGFPPKLPTIYLLEVPNLNKNGNRVSFGIDRFRVVPPKKDAIASLRSLLVPLDELGPLVEEEREFEKSDPQHEKVPERIDGLRARAAAFEAEMIRIFCERLQR